MDIVFNITKIIEENLTPTLYYYLYCLETDTAFPFGTPSQTQIYQLEKQGWLKVSEDGPIIRQQFKTKFKKYLDTSDISSWIEEWRLLWPSGIKSAGRPVKGSKQGCLKKMQAFIKNNPNTSKEAIFEATKGYLFEKSRVHYQYTTCADYFIEKDGVSLLESLIENNLERGSTLSQIENGGGAFHKEI